MPASAGRGRARGDPEWLRTEVVRRHVASQPDVRHSARGRPRFSGWRCSGYTCICPNQGCLLSGSASTRWLHPLSRWWRKHHLAESRSWFPETYVPDAQNGKTRSDDPHITLPNFVKLLNSKKHTYLQFFEVSFFWRFRGKRIGQNFSMRSHTVTRKRHYEVSR